MVLVIFQNILIGIFRRRLYKFLITIRRFLNIIDLQREKPQPVNNLSASRSTVKCHKQNISAFLEFSAQFVNLADCIQHRSAFYPSPIYGIRNLHRFFVLLFLHVSEHLLCFYPIFIFIQVSHLKNILYRQNSYNFTDISVS